MTWVIRDGELVERGSMRDIMHVLERRGRPNFALPTPNLTRDAIAPVRSMNDGKVYESRSQLYESYRRGGVRILEAGEGPREREERITTREVGEAIAKVRQGYKPQLPAADHSEMPNAQERA